MSSAAVAGPPSPESPEVPLPAKVLIVPAPFTLRTRLAPESLIRSLPEASKARPTG